MNRAIFLKKTIQKKGYCIKSFAAEINMPYTTLLSILNGSIGGASIDNIIKICEGLNITVEDLQSCKIRHEETKNIVLSNFEKELIYVYRQNIDMQEAVNKLLGLDKIIEQAKREKLNA